jgi:hypothetical protein
MRQWFPSCTTPGGVEGATTGSLRGWKSCRPVRLILFLKGLPEFCHPITGDDFACS